MDSKQVERAILGMCLLSHITADFVSKNVSKSDFEKTSHQIIFETMGSIRERNQPLDQVVLIEQLDENNSLEECEGKDYISELINECDLTDRKEVNLICELIK